MSISRKKKSAFLSMLLVMSILLSPLGSVRANAVSQQQIDDLKKDLELLEEQSEAQQEVIDSLTANGARVVDRKLALDKKIDLTLRQIDLINRQVEIYNEMIAEKEAELEEALAAENDQTELLRGRMRAMEENGNYSYVTFLFESDSFTDLLSRLADVSDIMHYDQRLEAEYMAAREDTELVKRSYEEICARQEDLVKELEGRKTELDSQVTAAAALIASIQDMTDGAQEEYDAIAKVRDETENEINELLRKLAEEEAARKAAEAARLAAQQAAQQQQQSGGTTSSGGGGSSGGNVVSLSSLTWPVPGHTVITSRFGYRTSPTAGASSYHGGLDIAADYGTTIVAAESGTVILASANGGYGNCVMINHGNGIVTLYGHMQSIGVSYGQTVSRGQYIGQVGSTGVSTGPHCHFEIRVNGAQTDPAPYFSGLSYWT